MNFQMFKLDLEKEEPEIKLPTSVASLKKQESSRTQPEGKMGLPRANPRGRLRSPS